jgi:glyoxylase-like metal-dependent hydrolase (beta-lactamase superfamily II)
MIFDTFPVGPLGCNCVILGDEESHQALVVDPGGDVETILDRLRQLGLQVRYLLHTHAHLDHVGASRQLALATGAEVLLHKADSWLYENLAMQGSLLGMPVGEPHPVDRYLVEGETIVAGKLGAEVFHTPGHSPGSVCFRIDGGEPLLLSGDTLFQGSIGRTDLWGGSYPDIIRSIKKKLLVLPDETVVHCGHGEPTTIDEERRTNPFLR